MNKALLLAPLLLLGIACSSISSGEVTNKDFYPAHNTLYMMPQTHRTCSGSGRTQTCSSYITYIPIITHVPDRFRLTIRNCETDKCKTGRVNVNENTYNTTPVGAWYGKPR